MVHSRDGPTHNQLIGLKMNTIDPLRWQFCYPSIDVKNHKSKVMSVKHVNMLPTWKCWWSVKNCPYNSPARSYVKESLDLWDMSLISPFCTPSVQANILNIVLASPNQKITLRRTNRTPAWPKGSRWPQFGAKNGSKISWMMTFLHNTCIPIPILWIN